jgi:hypothetical protein
MTKKSDVYAKSKFSTAVALMTGPEPFAVRVAAAWTEISVLDDREFEFSNPELQSDFEWLMAQVRTFAVGDRMRAKATDAECDAVRSRILKINALFNPPMP